MLERLRGGSAEELLTPLPDDDDVVSSQLRGRGRHLHSLHCGRGGIGCTFDGEELVLGELEDRVHLDARVRVERLNEELGIPRRSRLQHQHADARIDHAQKRRAPVVAVGSIARHRTDRHHIAIGAFPRLLHRERNGSRPGVIEGDGLAREEMALLEELHLSGLAGVTDAAHLR